MNRVQRTNQYRLSAPHRKGELRLFLGVSSALAFLGAILLVLALILGLSIGAVGYYNAVSASGLKRLKVSPFEMGLQPTRILDRNGNLLVELGSTGSALHQAVPLARIPIVMRNAVIASEDRTFYTNHGIDPAGMARAVQDLVSHSGVATSGGSTITQELVKNLVLGPRTTVTRKLQELVISYALASPKSGFSKNQILSLYLNQVFFGHQAYGIQGASKVFFGEDVSKLDLAQSAFLAGLVQAPSLYDPFLRIHEAGYDPVARMVGHVLPQMVKDKFITSAQAIAAAHEASTFVFKEPHVKVTTSQSLAPYWTDWIQNLLTEDSTGTNRWFVDPQLAAIVKNAGGLRAGLTIRTTLDVNLYNQAQQTMQNRVSQIQYNNVNDAAIVTLDPSSAECLDMVGGLDYNSAASGSQLNMAAQPRQPGSSFKVFTYLTAFEKGWYPAKLILDEPQTWPDSSEPNGIYAPTNYDQSWHGAVSIRLALANSYNMPAVKTIAAIGVGPVLDTARSMGLWKLRGVKKAGLSLTLGSKEVPLWQMAQAYNTLANGGVFRPMASILSIQDSSGAVDYTYHAPAGVQVVAPQYTYLATSIMKDNFARIPAFGANSVLQLGPDQQLSTNWAAAVKTGTSQNFRDNLTLGYTPNLLTATWVGNPDGSYMQNVEGVDGAGPIWHDVMEFGIQHLNLRHLDFVPPPGVLLSRISSSGMLASGLSAWTLTDVFAAGSLPHTFDDGSQPNYAGFRVLGNNFSLDGGNTSSLFSTSTSITSTHAISNGMLTYNPGAAAKICPGSGRYTYTPVYSNGQLSGYKYICH